MRGIGKTSVVERLKEGHSKEKEIDRYLSGMEGESSK